MGVQGNVIGTKKGSLFFLKESSLQLFFLMLGKMTKESSVEKARHQRRSEPRRRVFAPSVNEVGIQSQANDYEFFCLLFKRVLDSYGLYFRAICCI